MMQARREPVRRNFHLGNVQADFIKPSWSAEFGIRFMSRALAGRQKETTEECEP